VVCATTIFICPYVHASSLSQISYSLVMILELSDVLEVQYKEIMMSSINKNN